VPYPASLLTILALEQGTVQSVHYGKVLVLELAESGTEIEQLGIRHIERIDHPETQHRLPFVWNKYDYDEGPRFVDNFQRTS